MRGIGLQSSSQTRHEQPLSSGQKLALAASCVSTIALCYAFSIVSIVFLLMLLAVELVLLLGAARFGVARVITPLLKRHTPLLWIFLRSLWLRKGAEYRLLLQRSEAPRLFAIVDVLAQRFSVASPKEISVEVSANAWVRLPGYRSGADGTILAVGYDLLAALTEGQVEAVLGHEMGHAKFVRRGMKSVFDKGVGRIANLTSQLSTQVEGLRARGQDFTLEEFFLNLSDRLTRISARLLAKYSRQDEFEADRVSAELFGSHALSSALTQLNRVAERLRWLPWTARVAQLETEGSFSQWLTKELSPAAAEHESESKPSAGDPYSTHPSLPDRIAAMPPDNGARRSETPGLQLLADPDRVAERLIEEVHRIAAEQEQKDTKELARWSRKAQRSTSIRRAELVSVILATVGIVVGIGYMLDRSAVFAGIASPALIAAALVAWRLARYRDRVNIPTPMFAAIKASWQADRPHDLAEREKSIETECRSKIAVAKDKRRQIAVLLDEGCAALKRCDYLRAHVAARIAIGLNNKCVEAAMIIAVADAGLGFWEQMEHNLQFVRTSTRLATESTLWCAAWTLSLAGDWARAEAFLWQLLEKRPAHPTFLMLLALAQSQRGKTHSAILNAARAVSLQPNEYEHAKMMARFLLDAGRLKDCEKRLAAIESRSASDAEVAMLILKIRLLRREFDAAKAAADTLRCADGSPRWSIWIGHEFEASRCDEEAAGYFESARSAGYYPEALLGLARLAAKRGNKPEAKQHILAALNVDEPVGSGGRASSELFHSCVDQLMWLDEPREDCAAWIVTVPADATPSALAQRSLLVYARNRVAAESHLNTVLAAMTPGKRVTPAGNLQWREAPKHQQPARAVREGIQAVL